MGSKLGQLKETALSNFELLLDHWGVEYKCLGRGEYDFKNPARDDKNFGACRFNVEKARGADFAVNDPISENLIKAFGVGFSRSDFDTHIKGTPIRSGFDVVGLCQRIFRLPTYQEGADRLQSDLSAISSQQVIVIPLETAAEARREKQALENQVKIDYAKRLWRSAERVPFKGSVAEQYLREYRGIFHEDKAMRAHPGVLFSPLKQFLPALLFKVSKSPESPIEAVHRIFLSKSGKKADVPDPKRVIASVKGLGIWFGNPGDTLVITEGPEEALTCRESGCDFAVSTISAPNYHNLVIPNYVKKIVLAPDKDPAGWAAYERAKVSYARCDVSIQLGDVYCD